MIKINPTQYQDHWTLMKYLIKIESISVLTFVLSNPLQFPIRHSGSDELHRHSLPEVVNHLVKIFPTKDSFLPISYLSRASISLKTFTFMQYMHFVMLESTIKSINVSALPEIPPTWRPTTYTMIIPVLETIGRIWDHESGNIFIIPVSEVQYNFITCAGVASKMNFRFYTATLQPWVGIALVTSLATSTTIIVIMRREIESRVSLVQLFAKTGLTLMSSWFENYTPVVILNTWEKYLFITWWFSSLVITTEYKSLFTSEVITPWRSTSPYTNFGQIENFTLFSPVIREDRLVYYDNPAAGEAIPDVAIDLWNIAGSHSPYANIAEKALQRSEGKGFVYLKSLAYQYPSHFMGKLTPNCGNKAYVDTRENIERILPWASAVTGKVFVQGERPYLETGQKGWIWSPVAQNGDPRIMEDIVTRLQVMAMSGIYLYWKVLYEKYGLRKKLFQQFDNGTVEATGAGGDGLGLRSNVSTIMVILNFCSVICALVFVAELLCWLSGGLKLKCRKVTRKVYQRNRL
ncbi:hypothetical protein Fcan01_01284 [Folsomia candida]|uniref:Uncharacterized protein n=1 Tax=Folsomia candida TaxID=158441 RepID=A0A226EYF8_FOLCA|nr:hypothetical protein Fcan01_01284 [Folsomia candida]